MTGNYLVVSDFDPNLVKDADVEWGKRIGPLWVETLKLWRTNSVNFGHLFSKTPCVSGSLAAGISGKTLFQSFPPPEPDFHPTGVLFTNKLHIVWNGNWLAGQKGTTILAANLFGRISLSPVVQTTTVYLETMFPNLIPLWTIKESGWTSTDPFHFSKVVDLAQLRFTIELTASEMFFGYYPFAVNLDGPSPWELSALCIRHRMIMKQLMIRSRSDQVQTLVVNLGGLKQSLIVPTRNVSRRCHSVKNSRIPAFFSVEV